MSRHLSGTPEQVEQVGSDVGRNFLHGDDMCDKIAYGATNFLHSRRAIFPSQGCMPSTPIALMLKSLRESAQPTLSVRALAAELGISPSSYAFYEDPRRYKKSTLPVELTKRIADVLCERGIERSTVLHLAGLNGDGALAPTPGEIADQLDAVLLPEVQVSYSMGGGADIEDWPIVQMVPFSRAWLSSLTRSNPADLMVARGDGDSMMPTILDQDLVIIDRAQKSIHQQDRIWALAYGNLGMIKRVRSLPDGSYQINSDNAAVSPITATDDEMFPIGRVIAIIRRI